MADVQDQSAICFYRNSAGCRNPAVVHVFCKVEGRDTHFCTTHWQGWQSSIRGDDLMAQHCPRCAPAYLARREAQANSQKITVADEPITGPLADAIDDAMHAAGILEPQRREVLRRLAANTDAYVAAVMSRQTGAIALWRAASMLARMPILARILVPLPGPVHSRTRRRARSASPNRFACLTSSLATRTARSPGRRVRRPYAKGTARLLA